MVCHVVPESGNIDFLINELPMENKESKTKKMIRELSEAIDNLLEESDISKEDVKKEINARIAELKKSRDELNEELKKIREENKETFEKAEKLARNTAKEIKMAWSGFWEKVGRAGEEVEKDKEKEDE